MALEMMQSFGLPEDPKKPHIVLKNNFKKNKNSLSKELIKKINNLRFKFI